MSSFSPMVLEVEMEVMCFLACSENLSCVLPDLKDLPLVDCK